MARSRGPRLVVPVSLDDQEFEKGLQEALRRFRANSAQMGAATDRATTRVSRSLARADYAWTRFAARHERSISRIRRALLGWTSAYAGLISVYGLGQLTRSVARAGIAWEGMEASMKAAVGTSRGVERELRFVKDEAQRLGVEQMALAKSYVQLAAAAKGTIVEGQRVRDTFTAVAEAARVMQLSPHEVVRVMKAFTQSISKGKFSAEELRQQLGEVMPAVQMLARAMNVEPAVLEKMLEKGDVLLEQLPGLAAEIRRTYKGGLEDAQQSAAASFDRLRNSWTNLKIEIAESGVLDLLKYFADQTRAGISYSAMFRVRMSDDIPETLKGFTNRQLAGELARYERAIQDRIDLRSGKSVGNRRGIQPHETGLLAQIKDELDSYYALRQMALAEQQRRDDIEFELPPSQSLAPDKHELTWKRLENLYKKTRTPLENLQADIDKVTEAYVEGGPHMDKYREILERLHKQKAKLTGTEDQRLVTLKKYLTVYKSLLTPAERLQAQIKEVTKEIRLGGPDIGFYQDLLRRLRAEMAKLTAATNSTVEAMRQSFEDLDQSIAKNFASMLTGAQSFSATLANIFGGLANKLIEAGIMELIGGLFGGRGVGGGMADLLGLAGGVARVGYGSPGGGPSGGSPHRAEGGPVHGGRAVVVGERGREMFVPREDGYIVPAHRISERALTSRSSRRSRFQEMIDPISLGLGFATGRPLSAILGMISRGLGFSTGLGGAISRGFSPPAIWGGVDTGRPPAVEVGRHASTFAAPSYGGILSTGTFGVPSSGGVAWSAGTSALPDTSTSSAMTSSLGGYHTAGWGRGLSGGGDGGGGGAGYGGPGGGPSGGSPHRAEGGPVRRGMSVTVGERGRELFVPSLGGGGGGGSIRAPSVPRMGGAPAGRSGPTIYVDASGADVAAVERIEAMVFRLDGNLEQRAVSAVVQQQKRLAF